MTYRAVPIPFVTGDHYRLARNFLTAVFGGEENILFRINVLEGRSGLSGTFAGRAQTEMTRFMTTSGEDSWTVMDAIDRVRSAQFGMGAVADWGFDTEGPVGTHVPMFESLSDHLGITSPAIWRPAARYFQYDEDEATWSNLLDSGRFHAAGVYQEPPDVNIQEIWFHELQFKKTDAVDNGPLAPGGAHFYTVDNYNASPQPEADITFELMYGLFDLPSTGSNSLSLYLGGTPTGVTISGIGPSIPSVPDVIEISGIVNAWYSSPSSPPATDLIFYWWPTTLPPYDKGISQHNAHFPPDGIHDEVSGEKWIILWAYNAASDSLIWSIKE